MKKDWARLLKVGLNRQISNFSFGANTLLASKRFAKLGMQPEELGPRQINQMYVSTTNSLGSFAASYAQRTFHDRNEMKTLSAMYNKKVRSIGNLRVSAKRNLSGVAKTALYMNFSMPLGKRDQC